MGVGVLWSKGCDQHVLDGVSGVPYSVRPNMQRRTLVRVEGEADRPSGLLGGLQVSSHALLRVCQQHQIVGVCQDAQEHFVVQLEAHADGCCVAQDHFKGEIKDVRA